MEIFDSKLLKDLKLPGANSKKGENGQITIIGGSELFHGAPLLALTAASRFVDMVYFSSPEKSVGEIANSIKSKLFSFIWVPWNEVDSYIEKSDAVLIGPGLMRYRSEKSTEEERIACDETCRESSRVTEKFLKKFPEKKWVIDGGALQILEKEWIPEGAILTPNSKEYKGLFGEIDPSVAAKEYKCVIVDKRPVTKVCSPSRCIEIPGGNAGLTKGGTGDVQAGLTVALLAKNDPFLAGSTASYLVKKAADSLFDKVGTAYNADDLSLEVVKEFCKE